MNYKEFMTELFSKKSRGIYLIDSKEEYLKLKDSEIEVSFSNPYIKRRRANLNSPLNKFYKKAPIQKDCWINE